jgi:AcrR family transcriptional regulator
MPAPVDQEQRRQKITDIVAQIISRDGLDAVTIREVAAAAGYSTTIVTHYFANKKDLLLHTYQAAAARAQARVDKVLGDNEADLQGYLEALLPLDMDSLRDWRVYFAFWQVASIDIDFAKEQRRRMSQVRKILAAIITAQYRTVRPLQDAKPELIAKRLLTLLLGVAVQAIFDPKGWSATRQRRFLAEEIGMLFARK